MLENRVAIAGLALLLFASFGCTDTSGVQKTQVWGWHTLAGVAIMVMVLVLTLGYMVAAFMRDDKLKAWVGRELGQVFFSAIIIVAAVALVGSLDSWLQALSLAGGQDWQNYVNYGVCCQQGQPCAIPPGSNVRGRACHIELATDYLQVLYESARQSASSYLNNYGWFAFLSRLSMSASIVMKFLAGLSFSPFAGLEMVAEFFSLLFDLAIKTMFLVRAQQMFLDFLWYPLFPVMISIGLILRILYFTRKLGGMLIALALSLYIVFPMFYVLSSAILWGFMQHSQANAWDQFGNTYDSGTALPTYGGQALVPQQRAKNVFSQPSLRVDLCNSSTQSERDAMGAAMGEVSSNWASFENGRWYSQAFDFVTGGAFEIDGPIAHLAMLMLFTMFTPFLALMTMLAAFKVLSPLIGGDVEIQLLSKLI